MRPVVALVFVTLAAAAPAMAQDAMLTVQNSTSYGIKEFYGSVDGDVSWEENLLGGQTLAPGDSLSVNFDNGSGACVFDLKAVFDDGDQTIEQDFDVCANKTFTLLP